MLESGSASCYYPFGYTAYRHLAPKGSAQIMQRYFLINESDLSRDVVTTALREIKRTSPDNIDTPRLSAADGSGNFFATTQSIGQMRKLSDFLRGLNVPFQMTSERPQLKAPRVETRKATPEESRQIDKLFKNLSELMETFFGPK